MFSNMDEAEVVAIGGRYHLEQLMEQADYTIPLAEKDQAVQAAAPRVLERAKAQVEQMRPVLDDKELLKAEADVAADELRSALRDAKLWLRRADNYVNLATILGADLPDMPSGPRVRHSVVRALKAMDASMAYVDTHCDTLTEAGMPDDFLQQGRTVRDTLEKAQDGVAQVRALPQKLRDLQYGKGQCYLALKAINHIGRSIYADDREKAGQYNMAILYQES